MAGMPSHMFHPNINWLSPEQDLILRQILLQRALATSILEDQTVSLRLLGIPDDLLNTLMSQAEAHAQEIRMHAMAQCLPYACVVPSNSMFPGPVAMFPNDDLHHSSIIPITHAMGVPGEFYADGGVTQFLGEDVPMLEQKDGGGGFDVMDDELDGKTHANLFESIIECGYVPSDQPTRRITTMHIAELGGNVSVFTALADPLRRLLFKAADLAKVCNCPSNTLSMFLHRRKKSSNTGIFQSTGFKNKSMVDGRLKTGGYFLSLQACREFITHWHSSARHNKTGHLKRKVDDVSSSPPQSTRTIVMASSTEGKNLVHSREQHSRQQLQAAKEEKLEAMRPISGRERVDSHRLHQPAVGQDGQQMSLDALAGEAISLERKRQRAESTINGF